MMGNGEIWFDYKALQIKNLRLYQKQVEEAEDAILVAEEAQMWGEEREFYFAWDPIRYYQHLDVYEVIAREAKELERPLFRLFEDNRELSNPTPEEILMEVM